MAIIKTLNEIQTRLVAKKDNFNDFGKYKYRSAETILENIKPLLDGCAVVLNDELVDIDGRAYIKATATLMNDNGEAISASAYAQQDAHKGMSAEQAMGTCSSYARKYALCGLFAIDDNKDVDSMDNTYRNADTPKTADKAPKTTRQHSCADCGNPILDAKKTNGDVWKASDLAKYTKIRFGAELCYDCAEKRFKDENKGDNA